MIDSHCHLLPGIDDGAKNPDMSLTMAAVAANSGIRGIICTPHHLNGVFVNPRTALLPLLDEYRQRLADAGIDVNLHAGSELHLVPELPAQVLNGEALTYADRGRAILLELPKSTIPLGAETVIEQLLYHGITPVIAHPERNTQLLRHPDRVGEWVQWGCKLQLTAQSCSGAFGQNLRRLSRHWCRLGWVHLIASDAHRPSGRSPDTLVAGRAAIAEWLGEEAAELLTVINPQRLLDGAALHAPEPMADRESQPRWRSWFGTIGAGRTRRGTRTAR